MTSKKCTTCDVEKLLEEFYRQSANRDGHASRCKSCMQLLRPLVGTLLQKRRELKATATHKVCTKCHTEKLLSDFRSCTRGIIGVSSWCKQCYKDNSKQHVLTPAVRRERSLLSRYGLSVKDYDGLLQRQEGKCAICGAVSIGRKGAEHFAVDHDHVTGKVRALLCDGCNVAIGMMDENPERLEAAAQYLRAFKKE